MAADPITVRIFHDEYTSRTLAGNIRDDFNCRTSNELSVTVQAEIHDTAEVQPVYDTLENAIGNNAKDASSTRGIRQWVEDTNNGSWSEGTCYIWLTDYAEWPGNNGTSLGSAYGDTLINHECTDFAPHWAAGSADSDRNTQDDILGTFMHEYGHISMHSDHTHHNIYDYDTDNGNITYTTCMTGFGDESCTSGWEGSYRDTNFGPTQADIIEALVEYGSPAFEHDDPCQVSSECSDGWLIQDREKREAGPYKGAVGPEAIVDDIPGEPPAIE